MLAKIVPNWRTSIHLPLKAIILPKISVLGHFEGNIVKMVVNGFEWNCPKSTKNVTKTTHIFGFSYPIGEI